LITVCKKLDFDCEESGTSDVLRYLRSIGNAWWAREDSNLQPSGYEPLALTIELRARAACYTGRNAAAKSAEGLAGNPT
jgi:hypothetical protein